MLQYQIDAERRMHEARDCMPVTKFFQNIPAIILKKYQSQAMEIAVSFKKLYAKRDLLDKEYLGVDPSEWDRWCVCTDKLAECYDALWDTGKASMALWRIICADFDAFDIEEKERSKKKRIKVLKRELFELENS